MRNLAKNTVLHSKEEEHGNVSLFIKKVMRTDYCKEWK